MKSKKIITYIGIVLVVTIVVLIVGKKKGWFGKELTTQVSVEKMESRDIIEIITANGKIQPETEVKVSPDVSGEIVELYVKEGDQVKKGMLMLKIKPDNYISMRNRAEATLNSTRARLTQAKAQLSQSKLEFDRKSKLWEQKAISEAEFQQSETAWFSALAEKEAAEFSVASAEASLREAEEELRKTSIYAPMDGTISMLGVELGERVVGTSLMTGTELLRVADLSRMEVEVEVNENDIVRVQLGDTALVEVDAYLGRKFKGNVTEIPISANRSGLTTDQVTNFNVKILLIPESYEDLNKGNMLTPFRPGMSATADIQTDRKTGVFSLPIQAVTTRPDSIRVETDSTSITTDSPLTGERISVVFIAISDTAHARPVETGIQDDRYIEILSGVDTSERVISGPYSAVSKNLKHKSLIEVVDKDELFKKEK
jgi:HlyD family secretion protein